MSRTNQPDADSDRSRVHRLEFSVDWPPGHAAAYLIADEEPILVDAGMIGEQGRTELLEGLAAHGYEPADIDHLLLTHSHTDHVGQIQPVLEAGDPTVYAPALVRERFQRDLESIEAASRANIAEAGVDPASLDRAVDRLIEAHESNREGLSLEAVDGWIDADESVTVGDREFEPIYTPGHHVAHHCYGTTIGDERVVFAGDMAVEPFRAAAIHVNFDDGVREAIDAYFEALERMEAYSFDRVYPGHGPIHEEYGATVERSITDLEERVEACYEAVAAQDEATTATDVGAELTDSVSERARIMPEIVGSLARLERQGRVRSWLEDDVRYYESA